MPLPLSGEAGWPCQASPYVCYDFQHLRAGSAGKQWHNVFLSTNKPTLCKGMFISKCITLSKCVIIGIFLI